MSCATFFLHCKAFSGHFHCV